MTNSPQYRTILFLLLFPLCGTSSFAQDVTGEILYKKIIHSEDIQNTNSAVSRNVEAIANASEGLTYVLSFNSETSIFHVEDIAGRDSKPLDARATSIGGGKGVYYKKTNSGKTLHQTELFGSDFIVEIPDSKYDWEITKETKKIGSYTTRKAVASYTAKAPTEDLKDLVVHLEAWFTPEIPLAFGPREINALPGMVLEFSTGRTTYIAFEVSWNGHEETPAIVAPTKGKLISEKEFSQIAKEMMERLRN